MGGDFEMTKRIEPAYEKAENIWVITLDGNQNKVSAVEQSELPLHAD